MPRARRSSGYGSDRDLIEACREGDAGAWSAVLDRYERLVFSIPLGYGLSRHDAADVSQITFTILLQSLDSLREDSRLGPWLATVARRHTWRLMQRGLREGPNRGEDLADSAVLVGKGGTESVEHWETTEWLNQGLSLLNEPCRRLLTALYFDETQPSYAEVAERLNMPVGSIGPTRARCLKSLKQALNAP
ncbi:RNA polymerase sigma factor [Rubrobacter marinus]|uniref:RNA polymerase sigma factor n=1 Tax=Rubrobacter marinus TaxID=2653852 RepID=UPI00140BC02B|nr:sigma-70 family RNA polymerase sigma factor [Rubrobacter marinus]